MASVQLGRKNRGKYAKRLRVERVDEWRQGVYSPEFKACRKLGVVRAMILYSDHQNYDFMVGHMLVSAQQGHGFLADGKPISPERFIELALMKVKEVYKRKVNE